MAYQPDHSFFHNTYYDRTPDCVSKIITDLGWEVDRFMDPHLSIKVINQPLILLLQPVIMLILLTTRAIKAGDKIRNCQFVEYRAPRLKMINIYIVYIIYSLYSKLRVE